MEKLWQDIRYALRSFRQHPGLVAAIIGALALGIAANTVIFTVVNAALLNPLSLRSWHDPTRVVMLWEKNPSLNLFWGNEMPVRPRNFRVWKQQAQSFSELAALQDETLTLTDTNRTRRKPEEVEAGAVTADLFALMGVKPRIGRGFTSADMQTGSAGVALLSGELHKSRFQNDPNILGRTIVASGKAYTVIGVLPSGVALPTVWSGMEQKNPQLWIPLSITPGSQEDKAFSLYVFGRLKPGVPLARAQAEMRTIEGRLAKTDLEEGGFGINVEAIRQVNRDPSLSRAALVLQIAVLFVLLIACANAGNLLLGRAVARDKEMAVRRAIGAGRWRLVRQMFTESLLLSCAAAIVGLGLSAAGVSILQAIAPAETFALHQLRIDQYVLLFTALIAIATGLLFGLIPASHSWKDNLNVVLNRSARGVAGSSNRLRGALVVSEIALALILVTGAGLMVRSLIAIMNTDLGFRADHLLVMGVALRGGSYDKPEKIASFDNRLIESVRNLSGVESAALTTALPMKSVSQSSFEIPGRAKKANELPVTDWARVSDGYFQTLVMPLEKGRTFTREEVLSADPKAAVVNEAFAAKFFPHENVIGKQVAFGNERGGNTTYQIVGLVANEHQMGPDNKPATELYLPGQHLETFLLVARTAGDPSRFSNALKQQVWNIDKDQPVQEVMTEETALSEWAAPRRFNMIVLLAFAVIALVLAVMGLYSVLAYTVTLRKREIGIRVALGAEPKAVARYVMKGGLMLAIAGTVIGLAAAFALTRFMESLIFGVSAFDPVTFGGVACLLLIAACVASYAPAIRAAKIDPIEALRVE